MPAESPPDRVARGLDELTLRNKMGDTGYEDYKRRTDAAADASVLDAIRHADQTAATATQLTALANVLDAKAAFWRLLAFAVFAGTCCGVVEFARVVA